MNFFWDSSLYHKNLELFKNRFPQISIDSKFLDINYLAENSKLVVEASKDGNITAKDGSIYLHSKYNPIREAETLLKDVNSQTESVVFFSSGLGYAPILCAEKFPDAGIILIEPDSTRLLESFALLNWAPLLKNPKLIIAPECPPETAASLCFTFSNNPLFIKNKTWENLNTQYFTSLDLVIESRKQKDDINTNTLEKFSKLWANNCFRNLDQYKKCSGIIPLKNKTDLPFVILAAGPSLQNVLPYLKQIKNKSIIVCVETALHACLRAGVEPDFTVLVDPQYACYCHIKKLKSPDTILITESAAYPSVFRFDCKEILLIGSLFPVGKYFESILGTKGQLAAGGSVATTCWEFAKFCGSKEIYIAGMDLGFPFLQTHIKGSQFEELSHATSTRFLTAQTKDVSSLYSVNSSLETDYQGSTILSDRRMDFFADWFKRNVNFAKESNIKTFCLTKESRKISGIEYYNFEDFLNKPEPENFTQKKQSFMSIATDKCNRPDETYCNMFDSTYKDFIFAMEELNKLAVQGIKLSQKAIQERGLNKNTIIQLDSIDSNILKSKSKNAAALVFPTDRQLQEKARHLPNDERCFQFHYSKLVYSELLKATEQFLKKIR